MKYKEYKDLSSTTFIHFGNDQLLRGVTYNPSRGHLVNKPTKALWSSQYIKDSATKSTWEMYCLKNNLTKNTADFVFFRLKSNARILVIDRFEDLSNLEERYINKKLFNKKKFNETILNFENIYSDYHGIYVTQNGLKSCPIIFREWETESLALFTSDIIVKLNI